MAGVAQTLLGVGGLVAAFAVPAVLAAMARDRTLFAMLSEVQMSAQNTVKSAVDPIHERINRVRDEFVRREDLDGHLRRFEKQIDELKQNLKSSEERHTNRYDAIMESINELKTRNVGIT